MNRLKKRVREYKYHVGWDNPDNDGKLIYPYVHYLRRGTVFNGHPKTKEFGGYEGCLKHGIEKPHPKREDFEKNWINIRLSSSADNCTVFGNI